MGKWVALCGDIKAKERTSCRFCSAREPDFWWRREVPKIWPRPRTDSISVPRTQTHPDHPVDGQYSRWDPDPSRNNCSCRLHRNFLWIGWYVGIMNLQRSIEHCHWNLPVLWPVTQQDNRQARSLPKNENTPHRNLTASDSKGAMAMKARIRGTRSFMVMEMD